MAALIHDSVLQGRDRGNGGLEARTSWRGLGRGREERVGCEALECRAVLSRRCPAKLDEWNPAIWPAQVARPGWRQLGSLRCCLQHVRRRADMTTTTASGHQEHERRRGAERDEVLPLARFALRTARLHSSQLPAGVPAAAACSHASLLTRASSVARARMQSAAGAPGSGQPRT